MVSYYALRFAFAVAPWLPVRVRYWLGERGGDLFYALWPAKRRATQESMSKVVGDASCGPRTRMAARRSMRAYGRYIADFLALTGLGTARIAAMSRVDGWENLDRVLASGRGAVFVTCHFGAWDYATSVVAERCPGRLHVVVETFASTAIDKLVQSQRLGQGAHIIRMNAVREMIRALKDRELVAILADRPTAGDGVPINFFGEPTRVPGGAATLALITGTPILTGYLVRETTKSFFGQILPPIEPVDTGDRQGDIQRLTQRIFDALEEIIRRDPSQWYMFRNMWQDETAHDDLMRRAEVPA